MPTPSGVGCYDYKILTWIEATLQLIGLFKLKEVLVFVYYDNNNRNRK